MIKLRLSVNTEHEAIVQRPYFRAHLAGSCQVRPLISVQNRAALAEVRLRESAAASQIRYRAYALRAGVATVDTSNSHPLS